MSDLKGPPAELRFTVTVTRAKTGAVETYEMVGTPIPAPPQDAPVATDNEPSKEQ